MTSANKMVLLLCVTVLCFVMGTKMVSMRHPEPTRITAEYRI